MVRTTPGAWQIVKRMSGVPVAVLTIAPGAGGVSGVVAAASRNRSALAAPAAALPTTAATTVINLEIILSNVRRPAIGETPDGRDGQNALAGTTARDGIPFHATVQKRP